MLRALQLVIFIFALPLLVFAADWPASQELRDVQRRSSAALTNPALFAGWQILWSPTLDGPVMGFGEPVTVGTPANPQALLALVTAATGTHAEFEFVQETTVRGLTRTYYREKRDKLPVLGGRADVVRNSRGQISRWSLRTHDRWPLVDTHLLDAGAAAGALAAALPAAAWALDAERSFAAWFPDDARRVLRPVYWVRVAGKKLHERWEGIVDATSGEVLLSWPGIQADVSGTISGPYWQPYIQSPVQMAPYPFESVWVNDEEEDTTNASGEFTHPAGDSVQLYTPLVGPYVLIVVEGDTIRGMRRTEHAPYSPVTWNWAVGADGATAAELNLYYHVHRVRDWFLALDHNFVFPSAPVPTVANYSEVPDNAFWTGGALVFGRGDFMSNFAMFSDIIYHEYTHGVTDGIYPPNTLPYLGQPGALNEAWSDYFGCTINNDPYMAEYIGGNFNSWFRNLLQMHIYPEDWADEVHDDSRFVSEALWTVRTELGAATTDGLVHFSRYALAETFLDFLMAVLETDDDDGNLHNGTPHGLTIYNAFFAHGIAPSEDPEFALANITSHADGSGGSVGDGDRYLEAGETVELNVKLVNNAFIFAGPATGVAITVYSGDTALTVENGVQNLAELAASDTATLSPVLLHIAANAPDEWTQVTIDVTANGGQITFVDTVEFMIGTPQVLLVEADESSDVERFVRDRLHAQNRIYDRFAYTGAAPFADSLLPRPGIVIWLSGNAPGTLLTPTVQASLAQYMVDGNRVVLSGQNLLDMWNGTPFFDETLGISIANDSLAHAVTVVPSDVPFFAGDTLLLIGSSGAGNQRAVSALTPQGTSRVVARYTSGSGPVAVVEGAEGHALLFGFGIEAVSVAGTFLPLSGVLDRILMWGGVLDVTTPPAPFTLLPTVATLGQAYPNPFNSTTNLAYALPPVRGAELVVFDVLGRMVDRQRIEAAAGTLHWGLERASGVYFAQIRWNGGQTKPVKLLLVR